MVTKSKTIILYDGTKKRIFARAATELEAIKKLTSIERGQLTINNKITLATWATEWLETYLKPSVSDSSYAMYEAILRLHVLPRIGEVPLTALRPIQLQKCVNNLEAMSSSQIGKTRIVLGWLFKDARLNHLILTDPTEGVKWPKGYANERRALTPEERQWLMKAMSRHHRGVLFGFMYGCGLRPGEARALRWHDIKDGHVYVQHAIKKDGGVLGETKSKAGVRIIPMPVWLQEMVAKVPKTSLFVSPSAEGGFISADRLRDSWQSLKRAMYLEAGVPTYRNQLIPEETQKCSLFSVTMYYLRHTYATILLENGVHLRTVQYLMGHANMGVTSRVYTHVTNPALVSARDIINDIDFSGVTSVTNARPISYLPSVDAK